MLQVLPISKIIETTRTCTVAEGRLLHAYPHTAQLPCAPDRTVCSGSHALVSGLRSYNISAFFFSLKELPIVCLPFGHTKSGSAPRRKLFVSCKRWAASEGVAGAEGSPRRARDTKELQPGRPLGRPVGTLRKRVRRALAGRRWWRGGSRWARGAATRPAVPGSSQTLTHLLVVADLILRAVGPGGSSGDGLPPGQGHTLGFHSVPADLILFPGP